MEVSLESWTGFDSGVKQIDVVETIEVAMKERRGERRGEERLREEKR